MAGDAFAPSLRHRGMIVNHKKIRRLMRQHDLQPRQRRRYVATTDSDHDQPIYPNRARDLTIDGLNQLAPRTPLIVWIMPFTLFVLRARSRRGHCE
jgi:transposase InsO family protein